MDFQHLYALSDADTQAVQFRLGTAIDLVCEQYKIPLSEALMLAFLAVLQRDQNQAVTYAAQLDFIFDAASNTKKARKKFQKLGIEL